FAGEQKCLLSWKLDGLTVVVSYENGELVQALTRGNGVVGEDITHNALVFRNIPRKVAHTGTFSVRGEAIITFADFERINSTIEDEGDKYKNPRNLTSGSVRQLNSEVTAKRSVMYYAFSVIGGVGTDSKQEQLNFLQAQGFAVVPYVVVTADDIARQVAKFKAEVAGLPYATDGLVVTYDSIEYSRSLGQTSKFPHDSIAFKWADETAETTLTEVIWNTSRTGLINPVAVFEPVELEGSTVKQASLHNISIIEGLALGIGDRITVYKANMIIPQVADNLTRSGTLQIPEHCPVCGTATQILSENEVKTLFCPNPNCRAQLVRALAHYVSRDAANIEGLSEATLEKFVGAGFLNNYVDIYRLADYKDEIIAMDGFGEKSYAKLIAAIEKSRTIELASFINALGISNIGAENAKQLAANFDLIEDLVKNPLESLDESRLEEITEKLISIEGFGGKIATAVIAYFTDHNNRALFDEVMPILTLVKPAQHVTDGKFSGKTFVITGDLHGYENRKQLQAFIEQQGGKVAGSVSKNTDYLINNDSTSASSKNKKARELGIAIITEDEFNAL
ncbi:MAG: NAD-dependent DNA ligase LigA, partial [Defluviitaleaceae bacterium]|nr:NAD-dependent DNA ligase LigA [Defluviitaleaceae bacterium]